MLYIKALHIIFVVTWFAGLFYIVRLFIYHTEAGARPEPERSILQKQYRIMEKRLWYGITWPSMILTWIFGVTLAFLNPSYYFSSAWFWLKIAFVAGLTLYHLQCHVIFAQLQNDKITWKSFRLRLWNELATIFLVAIVFLVVLKNNEGLLWGLAGLVILSALIFLAARVYKNMREGGSKEKEDNTHDNHP
jgi:protoporphyrinogen IX oxidase